MAQNQHTVRPCSMSSTCKTLINMSDVRSKDIVTDRLKRFEDIALWTDEKLDQRIKCWINRSKIRLSYQKLTQKNQVEDGPEISN